MANVKNITELPVAESTDGINLIVNDNGAAKQIPANKVGAQPDWNETDETSPAFIMNKPEKLGSEGGGGAVNYKFYIGRFTDQDGNVATKQDIIDNFHKGVVRVAFVPESMDSNEWYTMLSYFYYSSYFSFSYATQNSISYKTTPFK